MESIFAFVSEHAIYAHWVIFGLLMLAGLNIPISEDLVILSSGVLASTIIPENTWKIFLAIFLGAYLSDCFVYFIGYRFGHKLWTMAWFSKMIKEERLAQVKRFYARFGMLTLFVGRFIPFGVRNCLFLSAGIGKMRPWKFVVSDGMACMISNTTLFSLAYFFGMHSSHLLNSLKYVKIAIFSGFCLAVLGFIWYKRLNARSIPQKKD